MNDNDVDSNDDVKEASTPVSQSGGRRRRSFTWTSKESFEQSTSPTMATTRSGLFFAVASGFQRQSSSSSQPHDECMADRNCHSSSNGQHSVTKQCTSTPHVIALVGLPARGKTYISKKLSRYLNWIGVQTKVINLGDIRRQCSKYSDHSVFASNNSEGIRLRNEICERGLNDALKYLECEGGEVVVFDATNTTRDRRKMLHDRVVKEKGFKLFFVESICDDNKIVEENIKAVKVTSPDYVDFTPDQVVDDFQKRISHYQEQYETLNEQLESELSFIKVFNAGEKVVVHKHEGHIQSRIVYYLMNVKITPRTIYLTRHGESEYNLQHRVGGDSKLTENGSKYSLELASFMNKLEEDNLLVWTSCMRRASNTAKYVCGAHERWKALNEIDVGVCDGMTYEEIQHSYPSDFVARDENKFSFRYSRGESYADLVARLEPIIMELERQGSVLVVSHQAVLRCILGYFLEVNEEELPYLEVPLHTLFILEPRAYGCQMNEVNLMPNIPCAVTHRSKPKFPGVM